MSPPLPPSADDPGFPTPDDLKHFNRITWLLGHNVFKHLFTKDVEIPTLPPVNDRRLPLLKALATLLVRRYEVVAVMPNSNDKEIFINEKSAEKYEHDDVISKESDFHSEKDRGMPAEENHRSLSVSTLTIEKATKFDPLDAIPTRFEDHVLVIINILKRGAASKTQPERVSMKEHLYTYILRACLLKIATRAAFHCTPVARAINNVDSAEATNDAKTPKSFNRRLRILNDFAHYLPPPPSWEEEMRAMADDFGNIKDYYKASLKGFVKSIGTAQGENDTWWSSDKTLKEHLSKLKTHALYGPLKQYVAMVYKHKLDEGFYLVAESRRVYHETFTSLLASCLFYLQLLANYKKSVEAPVVTDSAEELLIKHCTSCMIMLGTFLFASPILPIHLEWYLASTLDQGDSANSDEAISKGASGLGEGAEKEDNESAAEDNESTAEEDEWDEDQENEFSPNRATNSEFNSSSSSLVKSIMRWLLLLTDHHHSVSLLTKDRLHSLSRELRVHVLRIAMSKEDDKLDSEMESLDKCLAQFVEDTFDREALVEALQYPKKYSVFHGAYHCEAILASLYLLTKNNHNLHHDAIPKELEEKAARLNPFLCAVSKKCCPVCSTIYSVLSSNVDNDRSSVAATGTHSKFFPCRLPPWFPRKEARQVTERLEDCLRALITKKMEEIQCDRDPSTGSSVGGRVAAEDEILPVTTWRIDRVEKLRAGKEKDD